MTDREEIFPLVDEAGNIIGSATRQECHSGSMLLHPVVHLHIFRSGGYIFLQRRSLNKDIQPGRWDTAVGGHIDLGENVDMALRREAREELGIELSAPKPLLTYPFRSQIEYELINAFYITADDNFAPTIDPVEIDEARFWSIAEVDAAIGKNILTPNFEQEYQRIRHLIPQ